MTLIFIVLGCYLVNIVFIKSNDYKKQLVDKTTMSSSNSAPRGRIYDRNNKLLVDNKKVNTIYYKRDKNMSNRDIIKLCNKLSKVLVLEYDKLTDRNLREYWIFIHEKKANSLIKQKEKKKILERELSLDDLYNLKLERVSESELNKMSDIDRKSAYIYYLMNKGYSYDEKVIKKDASNKEYAYILEHESSLKGITAGYIWDREYLYGDTLRTILGNISTIPKEELKTYLKNGYEYNDMVGNSYLELQYEKYLRGKKAIYKTVNSKKKIITPESRGNDLVLTIDIDLQQKVDKILEEEILKTKKETNTKYYNKSYVVLQDPNNGEILALSGKKAILTNGEYKIIDYTQGILTEPMTVGSVVKGASILVGYNQHAIDIGSSFYDSCIKIKSTPKKCSWSNLGPINDIQALALSSNIYQFKTAMRVAGYEYSYNMPFKVSQDVFDLYRNMYHSFGLGVKTEIDLPIESLGYRGKDQDSGLLLDYVMGQYETYTPIQLSQYISTVANNGTRYAPHILKKVKNQNKDVIYEFRPKILNKVSTDPKYLSRVKEGFYAVINASYGIGHGYIDIKYNPAGKTGTSESFLDTDYDGIIDTETISTSFIGYAPSDNPKISITVTSPDISYIHSSSDFMAFTTRRISKQVTDEYFRKYNG